MNPFTRNGDVIAGDSGAARLASARSLMNSLIRTLIKLGILKEDLDYHLVRASMVIIFLFFGYQKWWEYEAEVLIPYISNGPLTFLDVPGFRHPGSQLVFRRLGMVDLRALVLRVLEQEPRHPWGSRLMCYIHQYRHYCSFYAEWLGRVGRRVPSNGWQRSFPGEGCRASCWVSLFAEAGCAKIFGCCQGPARSLCRGTFPSLRTAKEKAHVCRTI